MEPLQLDLGEPDDYLFWLAEKTKELKEASASQERIAVACRELGLSWGAIGKAMGVSRQAAQQRFGETPAQVPDPNTPPMFSAE